MGSKADMAALSTRQVVSATRHRVCVCVAASSLPV